MFKIRWIKNMDRFLSEVQNMKGDVLLHLPDNSRCSLKEGSTAQQVLKLMKPGDTGLSISLSDPNEMMNIIDYLISA